MNFYRHFTASEEQLEQFSFKRESSMQAYIIENEGVLGLNDGIYASKNVRIIEEELHLIDGRRSKFTNGRIDILAGYSEECLAVIELKLGCLNQEHLEQLEDYLNNKERLLEKIDDDESIENPNWIGILIGSSIKPELLNKISGGYQTSDGVKIAALTLQRYRSAQGGIYITTDIYFNSTNSERDYTKYEFNGKVLGKGRLVLEVIQQYVANQQPNIDYAGLEKAFPKKYQGSIGVFNAYEDAAKKPSRYFLNPKEVIELADCKIAVCNQWGKGNIEGFIEQAKNNGFEIEENQN